MARQFQSKIIKMNFARHMVITPVFRVSFPQVFEARSFQDAEGQAKNFQLDMIFDDKDDFKKPYAGKKVQTPSMSKALANAKADQWGPDKEKWPKFQYPVFKDGNDRKNRDGEIYSGYADKFFVTAKCGEKFPPRIIGKSGLPLTEADFYGGCYARAQLVARPYLFGKNFGVRFILFQLMKEKDGERFGNVAGDVFDVVEEEAADNAWVESGAEDEDDDF